MAVLVVVEDSPAALAEALAEARRGGLTIVEGWTPAAGASSVVCTGVVADAEDAAAALLAAVAGAGVIVDARASREVVHRLCEDLRKLGRLDHRTAPTGRTTGLSSDQRALLELIRDGFSLGEAAGRLHLSRRTADRRLAAARQALGVETTAEAVVALSRGG